MSKLCQRCGEPLDDFEDYCEKCNQELEHLTLLAFRQRADKVVPPGKFFHGFKTFPVEKYPAFLQITHRAMEWADRFSTKTETGLFFAGLPGIGKTGLAYAILRRVGERGFKIGCSTFPDLFMRYNATWDKRGESELDIMNEFLEPDLVFLDDLGAEDQSPGPQGARNAERLYALINKANERLSPILIVTSNLDEEDKKAYYESPNGKRFLPRLEQMCDEDALGPFPAINLREGASK